MDAERWQQIERLYHAALARPATERAAFSAEASGDDEALRSQVARLFDAPQRRTGCSQSRPPRSFLGPTILKGRS
jgi:hypothetical protein